MMKTSGKFCFQCFVVLTTIFCAVLCLCDDSNTKNELEKVKNHGWTPFRVSICEGAGFPASEVNLYGMGFNFPYGFVEKSAGLDLGLIHNADIARGMRIAGIVNMAEFVQAFEISGAANMAQDAKGCQIAGGANMTRGDHDGAQIAGFLNYSFKNQRGLRIAGMGNISEEAQVGCQITGGVNGARRCEGAQIAGVLNYEEEIQGLQLGTVNVIHANLRQNDHASGACQMGVFNWAKKIGKKTQEPIELDWLFQIGIVNCSGGAQGMQLGLLNFNPKGFLPCFPFVNFNW